MEVTIYRGKVFFDLAISNAPGHGDINVYAEICDPANLKPLSIIFQNALVLESSQTTGKDQIMNQFIKKERSS